MILFRRPFFQRHRDMEADQGFMPGFSLRRDFSPVPFHPLEVNKKARRRLSGENNPHPLSAKLQENNALPGLPFKRLSRRGHVALGTLFCSLSSPEESSNKSKRFTLFFTQESRKFLLAEDFLLRPEELPLFRRY